MIKYDSPYTSIATWICVLKDIDWFLSTNQKEIQWRMSLQFDKEDQGLDLKSISINDEVVPKKIYPVSPVIISKDWYPDKYFNVDFTDPTVKFDGGYMNKLTHLVFPGKKNSGFK